MQRYEVGIVFVVWFYWSGSTCPGVLVQFSRSCCTSPLAPWPSCGPVPLAQLQQRYNSLCERHTHVPNSIGQGEGHLIQKTSLLSSPLNAIVRREWLSDHGGVSLTPYAFKTCSSLQTHKSFQLLRPYLTRSFCCPQQLSQMAHQRRMKNSASLFPFAQGSVMNFPSPPARH